MKTRIRTLLSAVALAASGAASAAPIAHDNFDSYSAGAGIAGGTGGAGWGSNAWTGSGNATVVLAQGSDSPMSGNALRLAGANNNSAASRALASSVNTNVWVDFLFQFDGGVMQSNDFMGLWFGSNSGPNIGLKTNCGDGTLPGSSTSCDLDLFVRLGGSDGRYSTAVTIGETYRIVGHLQKTSGNTYNRFDMWVNPSDLELTGLTGIKATAASPGATGSGSTTLQSFNTIGFRIDGLDGSATNASTWDRLLIDELSLSSSAPLAARNGVPEPGSLALAGLALLAAGAVARRRVAR